MSKFIKPDIDPLVDLEAKINCSVALEEKNWRLGVILFLRLYEGVHVKGETN